VVYPLQSSSHMRLLPLYFLLITTTCAADDVWLGNLAPGVQVKVDEVSLGVAVTLDKDKDQIPKSIGITFFDVNGNKTALELKAVDPWTDPGPNPGSPQTRFSGTLSPAAQSFIGFEIQIPLGSEAPTFVRSEDLKRSN
jgi:hypothetical protein